jgi:hypothetical protein
MMKLRVGSFLTGTFVGAIALSTAFAAGGALGITWKKHQVRPVVLCRYDNIHGFVPKNAESAITAPSWKKEQVTPIVECRHDNIYDFTPLQSDSKIMAPNWKKENVTPWVEVVLTDAEEFQPLR